MPKCKKLDKDIKLPATYKLFIFSIHCAVRGSQLTAWVHTVT